MAVGGQTGKSALKAQGEDLIKQHLVYDDSGRVTDIYTASAVAPAGGSQSAPCTHVRYQYSAVAGQTNLVTGMIEELLQTGWQSAWDF